MVPKTTGEGREKADLFNRGRVTLDEVISALAELSNEWKFVALHVLDAAPSEIGGLLTGEAREVAFVYQRDVGTFRGEGGSGHSAIDTATDNHDVKRFRFEFLQICST